ncbi:hypothetical protein [Actinokineospora sp. NBRC 105648]|uniref:WD40/YVTN/BNR-like repeat-containing protein n=1 Tax=Actinokineospora sp. NBRC 105648 TaxID=3032206 RepID=UPI0024A5BF80|nr:hypothetical protein [Actinokineospora sp. NBRC 105648]GLZ36741.1 hypothetical protein Acsp05_03660 [Actinokineospora sp. NBRC 105648]
MPEQLDHRLSGLREWLGAAVSQPDLDVVLGRARARRTRRRVQLATVLVVVAATATVPILRVPAVAPVGDRSPMWVEETYQIAVGDAPRLYALRLQCLAPRCQMDLRAAPDGKTWEARPTPVRDREATTDYRPVVTPLRGDLLVADSMSLTTLPRRFFSTDSGRTWSEVAAQIKGSQPRIQPGTVLEARCVGHELEACVTRVTVTDLGSGERRFLTGQPNLYDISAQRVPAGDGNWWISGTLPGSTTWVTSVTRDNGATWETAELAPVPGVVSGVEVSGWGSTMYAVLRMRTGPSYVQRSNDDGRSWTRLGTVPDTPTAGPLVVGRDGSLLAVTHAGRRFRWSPGMPDFAPDAAGPEIDSVRWTRSGYLATIPGQTRQARLSADGIGWQDVRAG